MSNATYLVTNQAQIMKIVGETTDKEGIVYKAKSVRSHKRECFFVEEEGAEVEAIKEANVSLVDTNYSVLRNQVDKVLGIID